MNISTASAENDQFHLSRMLDCIQRIESYTQASRQIFLKSKMVQDAAICNLELIGEAARRLSAPAAPIPRERLSSLANHLIDHYMDVNLEEVWHVIERELPALRSQVEQILTELP